MMFNINFFISLCIYRAISSVLVVVQTVAHDKVVGNGNGHVIDLARPLVRVGLDEQAAHLVRGRLFPQNPVGEHVDGEARVHDVFHDDDVLAVQRTSLRSVAKVTSPAECMPWYDLARINVTEHGTVTYFIRSAVNMKAPLSTDTNLISLPA